MSTLHELRSAYNSSESFFSDSFDEIIKTCRRLFDKFMYMPIWQQTSCIFILDTINTKVLQIAPYSDQLTELNRCITFLKDCYSRLKKTRTFWKNPNYGKMTRAALKDDLFIFRVWILVNCL